MPELVTTEVLTGIVSKVRDELDEKASKAIYTATIKKDGINWVEDDGCWYNGIVTSGILKTDTPIVSPVYTGTTETDKAILEAWNCISRIKTSDGVVYAYCFEEKPSVEIPIQLEVIR